MDYLYVKVDKHVKPEDVLHVEADKTWNVVKYLHMQVHGVNLYQLHHCRH